MAARAWDTTVARMAEPTAAQTTVRLMAAQARVTTVEPTAALTVGPTAALTVGPTVALTVEPMAALTAEQTAPHSP